MLVWLLASDDLVTVLAPLRLCPGVEILTVVNRALGWCLRDILARSETFPDQVGTLLDAPKQYRMGAQCQSVSPEFDQTLLVNTDPVGKQAELHVMDYRVSPQLVGSAIGDVGLLGLRFLLGGPAQKVLSGKLQAVIGPMIATNMYPSWLYMMYPTASSPSR